MIKMRGIYFFEGLVGFFFQLLFVEISNNTAAFCSLYLAHVDFMKVVVILHMCEFFCSSRFFWQTSSGITVKKILNIIINKAVLINVVPGSTWAYMVLLLIVPLAHICSIEGTLSNKYNPPFC